MFDDSAEKGNFHVFLKAMERMERRSDAGGRIRKVITLDLSSQCAVHDMSVLARVAQEVFLDHCRNGLSFRTSALELARRTHAGVPHQAESGRAQTIASPTSSLRVLGSSCFDKQY